MSNPPRFAQPGDPLRPLLVKSMSIDYCLVSEDDANATNYMPTLPFDLGFASGTRKRLFVRFCPPCRCRWLLGLRFGAIEIAGGSTGYLEATANIYYVTDPFDPRDLTWNTQPGTPFSSGYSALCDSRSIAGGGGYESPTDGFDRGWSYPQSTDQVIEDAVSDELGWMICGNPHSSQDLLFSVSDGRTRYFGLCVTFEEATYNSQTEATYPDLPEPIQTDDVFVSADLQEMVFLGEPRNP